MAVPVLNDLAIDEYDIDKIYYYDVDKYDYDDLAALGYDTSAVPQLYYVEDGVIVDRSLDDSYSYVDDETDQDNLVEYFTVLYTDFIENNLD